MQRICVYCGSNKGARPEYTQAAEDLADVLVRHELELVYGGAHKGMMGIIADRVLESVNHRIREVSGGGVVAARAGVDP